MLDTEELVYTRKNMLYVQADAFNFAADVSPTASVPPLPSAAAATDDMFDFKPINRGTGFSSLLVK